MMDNEQTKAYQRFIKARDAIGLVRVKGYGKRTWIRQATHTPVDVVGFNHPLYEVNEPFIEYLEASRDWWSIEPEYRKTERLSAIRGDYGASDSWNEETPRVHDVVKHIEE